MMGLGTACAVSLNLYFRCVNASVDTFEITITGKGGHAARPSKCVDPIVVGSQVVLAIQTILSRQLHQDEAAVLTIGKFCAGTAPNIIPDTAVLEGTFRTLNTATRTTIKDKLELICKQTCAAFGASCDIKYVPPNPPLVNTSALYQVVSEAAISVVGSDNVKPLPQSNMGGEDFSHYLVERCTDSGDKVVTPGFYVRYGGAVEGESNRPPHSGDWDFNEKTLLVGAKFLAAAATHMSRKLATDLQ